MGRQRATLHRKRAVALDTLGAIARTEQIEGATTNDDIRCAVDACRSLCLQVILIPVATTRRSDIQRAALHQKVLVGVNAVLYRTVERQRAEVSLQLHILVAFKGMLAATVDGQ